jgi:hypothetical protein
MKNVLLLIVGMIAGYAVSGVVPMSELKATLLNMETPYMSGGHELNTEAGTKQEAPKQ